MAAADEALRPRCVRFCATVSSRGGARAFVHMSSFVREAGTRAGSCPRQEKEKKKAKRCFFFLPNFSTDSWCPLCTQLRGAFFLKAACLPPPFPTLQDASRR